MVSPLSTRPLSAGPITAGDVTVLQQAFAKLQAGDGAGALAQVGRLPPTVQAHPDALMVAAMAHRAQADFTAARPLFEAATRAAPANSGIWNGYANLLGDLGDHDAAIAAYEKALAIDPRTARIWINLGLAAIAGHHFDTAAAALERAIALAPGSAAALSALGLLEQKRGALGASVTAFTQSLAIAPADRIARHNLATTLRLLGRPADALEALGTPDRPDSGALRGHLLADIGDFDAAIDQYECVLAGAPAHAVALEALTALLPQLGRSDTALAGYHRALNDSAPPSLWTAAIAAASGAGNPAQSLEWARAAQAAHGPTNGWQLAEANALSQQNDTAAALQIATAVANEAPDADAENLLAWLMLKAGAPDRAEAHALAATRLAPRNQSPWALLTLIWRLLGDPRESWLADYDRLVMTAKVAPPPGWTDLTAFLADLGETLDRRHQTLAAPADQSLRGGTQTRGNLFDDPDPVLHALKNALVAAADASLAALTPDPAHPFLGRLTHGIAMAGSWSVRLRSQGFHISHIHHQGWLSSAFHIGIPPEIGGDGNAGKLLFGVPDAALGLDLPPRRVVIPMPGRLVLFPSYLWHGTAPFESTLPRLSVAFDALPQV